MNFKDSYKQENEEIRPDGAFIDQLAQQMKQEQRAQRNRKKIWVSTGSLAAAAVLCIVVFQGMKPTAPIEQQDMQVKAQAEETQATGHGFDYQAWYGDAETEEEIFAAFQTLLEEEQVKTLYCSDTEEYNEEDILSEEEVDELVRTLQGAEHSEEDVSVTCKYYMAVFENGSIVKFKIYQDEYLILKDSESVYSLK